MKKRLRNAVAIPREKNFWYTLTALLLVLALMVPVLAACDDDDDDKTTSETEPTSSQAEPTSSQTEPTTTSTGGPVRLGVISSWTGPAAVVGNSFVDPVLDVIKQQVEEAGGILEGRQVEFEKHDDESSVAGATAGVAKLASDDSISAILLGGASGAAIQATADACGKAKIPFFAIYTEFPEDADLSYTTAIGNSYDDTFRWLMDEAYKLEPKTIAFFGIQDYTATDVAPTYKDEAEDMGIDIVYDQMFQADVTDMSSYVTAIKGADPEVLIFMPSRAPHPTNFFRAVGEQAGLGDMKIFSPHSQTLTAAADTNAEGLISFGYWIAGLPYPGAQAFEQAYVKTHDAVPPYEGIALMYWGIWTGIHAVELADSTDRDDINKAAHSGDLSWDTPGGPVTVGTDGYGYVPGYFFEVKSGVPEVLEMVDVSP